MKNNIFGSMAAVCLTMAFAAGSPAFGQQPRKIVLGNQLSYLGVGVVEVTTERAKALNLKEERGAEITRVDEDSPAAKAGLKVEDVVLEYQGTRIEGTEQFVRMVRETPSGRAAKLQIMRAGQPMTMTATIGARKAMVLESGGFRLDMPDVPEIRTFEMPKMRMSWQSPMLGVDAEALSPQLATYFGVKEGVLIMSVAKDSAAERAGLKAGDVIVKVGDKAVTSPSEVSRQLRAGDEDKKTVTVMRDRKEMTITVEVASRDRRPTSTRAIRGQQF